MIILYHYSDKKIIGQLRVKHFGQNYFTRNDKNISSVKRIYFYDVKNPQEYIFNNAEYCYIVKVNKNKIYDITKDKRGFYSGNITDLLNKVKKSGYIGVKYNIEYNVISLLYDIPIYKTIKREV